MQAVLARFQLPELPAPEELARVVAVCGCALALIFAGPLVPF